MELNRPSEVLSPADSSSCLPLFVPSQQPRMRMLMLTRTAGRDDISSSIVGE